MSSLTEILTKYVKPHYYKILIGVVFIIFTMAGLYAFNNYKKNKKSEKKNKFSDVANATMREPEIIIYFFHVDWCPHCKTAMPEWKRFKKSYDGKVLNGYDLKCVEYNCTEETSEVTAMINKYKLEGYPTVKMIKDGQVIEFDSKITNNALEQFVNTMV